MSLLVVAAVIRDDRGRILLTQRPAGKHLAGTWEFPGGKLEPGEDPAAGLARELQEELDLTVHSSAPLLALTHAYPDRTIRLLLRDVRSWEGRPQGLEGQALRWLDPNAVNHLPMPAADRPILKALCLDPRYAISPAPAAFESLDCFLKDWESRLDAGYRWLQLRAHALAGPALAKLAEGCGRLARRYGARWLLNGPPELAEHAGADGVHLSANALRSCTARPLSEDRIVCASCHETSDLMRAGQLGLDFVTLSPVQASHSCPPQRAALEWAGFEALCRCSPLPVLALGGLNPSDLAEARERGGFGVAGTTAFTGR
ncbi:MAG: Nudix family hydrolase [Wenzhouxiangella sp.]|nr:MAG: Nudix family hydrolase [Wenzhouxiangella sp.]